MMRDVKKVSPVNLKAQPEETEMINGFDVALSYKGDPEVPVLVDLSHAPKWNVQHPDLDSLTPWGLAMPAKPGEAVFQDDTLLARLNPGEAVAWHLGREEKPAPVEPYFTDITDGTALVAILGQTALQVMERLCSLDLTPPNAKHPFLLQGPVSHITCQTALLGPVDGKQAVLVGFAGSYAKDMIHAISQAGEPGGLRPGGLDDLAAWLGAAPQD